MSIRIGPEQLSTAIMDALQIYSHEVTEGISKAGEKVAKEAVATLRSTSPKRTKAYSKSWAVKKETQHGKPTSYIIHNRKRYRLTHLLEKGYAKRGGGRVDAQVHIEPVEEKVINDYVAAVEKVIKGG